MIIKQNGSSTSFHFGTSSKWVDVFANNGEKQPNTVKSLSQIRSSKVIRSAYHFKSCRFITVMRARLKVPAKNSPALLFLSRGKAADCCCFSFFFFSPAEEEQSRRIFGGNFQTRAHDGNKAAGHKVTGWLNQFICPPNVHFLSSV